MPFFFSGDIEMGELHPRTPRRLSCIVCGERAVHLHHVAYRQWGRDTDGNLDDAKNLAPVCFYCHGAHHNASRRIPRSVLPIETLSYIEELGPRIVARFEAAYPEDQYGRSDSAA